MFLWVPLLYIVVLCTIFMVIPWNLEELFPVALTRLMMHTAPLLFLWVCFGNPRLPPKHTERKQGWFLADSGREWL